MSDEDRELSRTILRGMREIVANTPKKKELEPPDLERCQADIRPSHSFMTLGPRPSWERCREKPTAIVREKKPGKDGQCGSMSLCTSCLVQFMMKMCPKDGDYEFEEIKKGDK